MSDTRITCLSCNTSGHPDKTEVWHPFRHPVNTGGKWNAKDTKEQPEPETRPAEWPFDPVLRQALIDKGVLTPDDLMNAENKIRAVTSLMKLNPKANVMVGGQIYVAGNVTPIKDYRPDLEQDLMELEIPGG